MHEISKRVKLVEQAEVPDLWKKMEKENKEKRWVHLGPTRTPFFGGLHSPAATMARLWPIVCHKGLLTW